VRLHNREMQITSLRPEILIPTAPGRRVSHDNSRSVAVQFGSQEPQTSQPVFVSQGSSPALTRKQRLWRWVKHGMPLTPVDYDSQQHLTRSEKMKRFARRRIPFVLVMAATLGIVPKVLVERSIIASIPQTAIVRSQHPNPWPDNVKVYGAVAQNSLAYSSDVQNHGWFFRNIGLAEGWYTDNLMNGLARRDVNSLDEAYQRLSDGYGPMRMYASSRLQPSASPEGPLGWKKDEVKKRQAILVVWGR
jgi:hypothetical protein